MKNRPAKWIARNERDEGSLCARVVPLFFALLVSTSVFAQSEPKGDPQLGKQLFQAKGCYSCHGFVGQGSREGPRLTPAIALPAFVAQLRTPRAIMPPYQEMLVSDKQAADIHAYLESLPKPPDPKSVRLLQ